MRIKWWMPIVALGGGLIVVLAIGAQVNPDVAARLKRTFRNFHGHGGSTLRMDDGVHELYVAWNEAGVQDAAVDGKTVPPEQVTNEHGIVRIRGVVDEQGWPLYEAHAWTDEGNLRLIPGDARIRLGLRLAAAPDADGALPMLAESIPSEGRVRGGAKSPAQLGGVQPGDALLAVDGVRPATREALEAALRARRDDEPLPLLVRRGGAEVELVLHPLALNGDNFWTYDEDNEGARRRERKLIEQGVLPAAPEAGAPDQRTADQGTDTSR
jgi:hypothetical protein